MEPRSFLYVPGDRPDRFAKAAASGADAIILDLEDGVAASAKDTAREAVAEWLAAEGNDCPAEVWVRINSGERAEGDLAAVGRTRVLVPKAEVTALTRATATASAVGALIETANGWLDCRAIAAVAGVERLSIGEADLTAELGIDPSADEHELWPLRMTVVAASAAAGIAAPTGPVSTAVRDLDGLRASTELLRRAGFAARACIHPDQVPIVNEVFTPTEEELARASALVARYDESLAAGSGVCIDESGRMIDEAVVRPARRLLARRR